MKESTVRQLRALADDPLLAPVEAKGEDVARPEVAARRAYDRRRAELGKLAREEEDNHDLMMLGQVLSDRDADPDHTLAGNIETVNAMLSEFAKTKTS